MLKKISKKQAVAAKIESYQRGYHVGFSCASKKENIAFKKHSVAAKKEKKARRVRRNIAFKKHSVAAKLEAYQKGYHLGVCRGSQQEQGRQTHLIKEQKGAQKSRNIKRGLARGKLFVAAKRKAYLNGVRYGTKKAQASLVKGSLTTVSRSGRPLKAKARKSPPATARRPTPKPVIRRDPTPVQTLQNGSTPVQTLQNAIDAMLNTQILPRRARIPARTARASASPAELAPKAGRMSPVAVHDTPTPTRTASRVELSPEADNSYLKFHSDLTKPSKAMLEPTTVSAHTLREASKLTQGAGAEAMRAFLQHPAGVTSKPASFQLRCTQTTQGAAPRELVVIVGWKCTLWKLNQIIAECFNASQHNFVHDAKKGTAVLGSRFVVSRPLQPGQCSRVSICTHASASHVGSALAFIDDRNCAVAQLFRGRSTGSSLQHAPADAVQQVVFASPLLSGEVALSLDGIMLDSYDNRNPFDKNRRHSNGRKPLPRVAHSSFMSVAEIEAKNFVIQGYQEGDDLLVKFDSSYPAIHEFYRHSQRKPLFHKDGKDYALHLGHDEEKRQVGGRRFIAEPLFDID